MKLSVVIPLYNENELISQLVEEVSQSLKTIGKSFEIWCVDDGSNDNTLERVLNLRKTYPELKAVSLSRNFGLQAAINAGLDNATGEYVVIMDGDLQDPPQLIQDLYNKIKTSGADIVSAVRNQRKEKFGKRFYIKVFHKVFSNVSEGDQIEQTGNFCILNRKATDAILQFTERNRYFPGIRNFIGFKHEFIVYDRPERASGSAKMDRNRLFKLAADAIFSFSKWPIKACLYLGLSGVVLFFLAIIYTLVSKFTGLAPFGWSSTFLAISFFGSVQLTFLGIIGEYIYRIYKEVQQRPIYLVKDIYDSKPEEKVIVSK